MTDVITNQEVDANIVKTVRNLKTHSSSKQEIKDISSNQIEDSKNNTNSQFNKSLPVRRQSRIAIDGSEHTKNTRTSLYKSTTSNGFIKTKSKYIQNLMNEANMKKYKQSCMSLVKNDNEILKLYEECGYQKTNYSFENFVEKIFSDKIFLYKLEFLLTNSSDSIFKKNYKEKFYKEEILKLLNIATKNKKYSVSIERLSTAFETQLMLIQSYNFIK